MLTIADIRERLSEIRLLGTKVDIVRAGFVQRIGWDGTRIEVDLIVPPVSLHATQVLEADIRRSLGALPEVQDVSVRISGGGRGEGARNPEGVLQGVRQVIAVASAKGGVGKSTVAANLALALSSEGLRVGLLDADVYGPSLPLLFGTRGPVTITVSQRLAPVSKFGLQLMSVGFFVEEEAPVIWRGPVVMSLVRQFLRDVEWRDLDILLVDLPPGTGDAPLSLLQLIPVAGAVIVTTPQQVAIADVERGIAMFQRVQAPVLGIVENMGVYRCPHCGSEEELFGEGGGEALHRKFGIPLIARIPLEAHLREASDTGEPLPVRAPHHPVVQMFRQLSHRVLERLAEVDREVLPTPRIIN
ncbi:MAG: Mrp/NBP35 family ATP-binding protein [Candidatus Binatia bacterium]|nr:Mrp/NBP35 family ATP-binding protein [Candidatus Binatia bacterium]